MRRVESSRERGDPAAGGEWHALLVADEHIDASGTETASEEEEPALLPVIWRTRRTARE